MMLQLEAINKDNEQEIINIIEEIHSLVGPSSDGIIDGIELEHEVAGEEGSHDCVADGGVAARGRKTPETGNSLNS